jgi:puromycin-sensitive aminopeptidase
VRKNFLLQTNSETLDMKEFLGDKTDATSAWIKLNVDQTGFYRVKYDEDLSARLRYAIENKFLSATDRFGNWDISTHSYLHFPSDGKKRAVNNVFL